MKFQEAAKYYYYPGMHEPGSTLACGVNKSWFTSLTKSDQLMIKTACDWADTTTMAEYNAKNGFVIPQIASRRNVNGVPRGEIHFNESPIYKESEPFGGRNSPSFHTL
jgi:TRAP-type mannitol/chloroaromatic compound transport system substrate-binding protein